MLIGSWTIRGLNDPQKQRGVISFLRAHDIGLLGLVETHISSANVHNICNRSFPNYRWYGNYSHDNDGRILILWDPNWADVSILFDSSQLIHCMVKTKKFSLLVTFVYGLNEGKDRLPLWNDLRTISSLISSPWVCLGDFNAILSLSERISRASPKQSDIDDFSDCLMDCFLADLPFSGPTFTWSNKQRGGDRIWSKLDRVVGNGEFANAFPSMSVKFLESSESDHTQVLHSPTQAVPRGRRPFKFLNSWSQLPDFPSLLREVWDKHIDGCKMFVLVSKLRILKSHLKLWNVSHSSKLKKDIDDLEKELGGLQNKIRLDRLANRVVEDDFDQEASIL